MDLLLFDIDGTLLRTRGAGREALDVAFLRVMGWPDATAGISLAGATDGGIVRGVAARFGVTWDIAVPPPFDVGAIRRVYLEALAGRLREPGRVAACPGVHALVASLAGRAHLSLLTGNWRAGAALKLGAIGLAEGWIAGAFGDDHTDRNCLVPFAVDRARAAGIAFRRVIVIGDTPADVACARAGGAYAVAVETGFSTPAELAGARPDLLLPDLDRGRAWIEALVA
ncbi:MAG: haloacid dehalogenase-like hydrolase [Pseudomonadota bacterium]|nr:haloacid dehalogenase-like hydrolase [Pseudomonadota bacterium]